MRFERPASDPRPAARWRTLLRKHWVFPLILVLMSMHGIVFALVKLQAGDSAPAPLARELTLGEFAFEVSEGEPGEIQSARFKLHVSLLGSCPRDAELLFSRRRFKLQQALEESLRLAQASDFSDPQLVAIKRQFQELINQTLGIRVVEEVLITDLRLTRGSRVGCT